MKNTSFILTLSLIASNDSYPGCAFAFTSPSVAASLVDQTVTVTTSTGTSAFITSLNNHHHHHLSFHSSNNQRTCTFLSSRTCCSTKLHMVGGGGNFFRPIKRKGNDDEDNFNEDDDDDDDDEEEESLYEQFASSEFLKEDSSSSQITPTQSSSSSSSSSSKPIDWGGEYDTLRNRFEDVQKNKIGPSQTLFRIMTSQTPNEAIMSFINDASPQVVTAMSSTVTSLLGGLSMSNPNNGMETIVKANGEKLGSLCFQLQMTGYMFRNAEYVLAIRDLMNIHGKATLQDYKKAFDRLDSDGSGYIESDEIYDLLKDVYGEEEGDIPTFEVDAFLKFFDSNKDGRISWDEFESGLGVVADNKAKESRRMSRTTSKGVLPGSINDDDEEEEEDDDEVEALVEPNISGKVKIEMKNGRVIEVEAKEYIEELKKEAEALKAALRREKSSVPEDMSNDNMNMPPTMGGGLQPPGAPSNENNLGISGYIASLGGDLESLTKGISPEVIDAMKKLIDFVLDGGPSGRGKDRKNDRELEMELPSSALQQLALWQLVLGYKLREAEATGEYRKMLE